MSRVLENLAKRRKNRRMNGECSECGKPAAPYKACEACRKWRRAWIKKRRAALYGKLCILCKMKLAKTSVVFCQKHLDLQNVNAKNRYKRQRELGKCTRCHSAPMRGSTRCRRHAAEQSAAQAAYARRRLHRRKTHQNVSEAAA